MCLVFRSPRLHSFQRRSSWPWLSPRLSRGARGWGLHGFFGCCCLRGHLHCRFPGIRGFPFTRGHFLCRRRIAEVNRRVRTAGAFARSESRNRPNRFDARSRRRHLRNRALPLRADLVAIVAGAVDARLGKLRRGHRRVLRKVPLLGEQGVDLLLNLFPAFGVEQLFTRQEFFVECYRVARFPIRAHLFRHVFGGIVLRVAHAPKSLGFDQNRPFPSPRPLHRLLRCGIHRDHIIAVNNVALDPIRLRTVREILERHLLAHRCRIRPQIILKNQNKRRLLHGRKIQPFVKHSRRAAAVANPRHGHDLLAQITSRHRHTGHHRNQIPQHRNRRNDVQIVQIPEVAGAILALGRRIILRHVLHENIPRPYTLHQQRPDVADHRRQPVLLFQRVCRSHGNRFLAETGVKPPDNFVLPEQLHHHVFDGAVQPHVVVQVQVLLPRQFLLHPRSSSYAESTAACSACSSFSSNSLFVASFISSPSNSPRCFAIHGATSLSFTLRPSNFSSDVAFRSAIPHGTIRSKFRKSVDTLYANPCEVTQRLMRTPMAASFSSVLPARTQIPVFPATRSAVIPNSAVARIIASSSIRTYHRTSRRIAPRFRIGYPTICPGP